MGSVYMAPLQSSNLQIWFYLLLTDIFILLYQWETDTMTVGEGETLEVKNKRRTQIWGKATQTLLVATKLEYDSIV